MSDCVFCKIVGGSAPALFRYTWPDAVAIVPLGPVVPGHMLVLPRAHVRDAAEDPSVTASVMYRAAEAAQRLGQDCNIITSVGPDATQTVFHLHVHVVPRRPGDDLALPWTGQEVSR